MPTSRCPVVRPQAGFYGARGFTTDYHGWPKGGGPCTFCGATRKQAAATGASARTWGERRAVGDPPPHESFVDAPANPERWRSVTSLLQREAGGA